MRWCDIVKDAPSLISDLGEDLELDLGVGYPHIRRIRSTIRLSRRVWHLCIPRIGSIVGHPSSCRTRRWSSLGRLGERLCIWPSHHPRLPWRYRNLLWWLE